MWVALVVLKRSAMCFWWVMGRINPTFLNM